MGVAFQLEQGKEKVLQSDTTPCFSKVIFPRSLKQKAYSPFASIFWGSTYWGYPGLDESSHALKNGQSNKTAYRTTKALRQHIGWGSLLAQFFLTRILYYLHKRKESYEIIMDRIRLNSCWGRDVSGLISQQCAWD